MVNNDLNALLQLLDIKISNESLIKQAFIHRSYLNEVKDNLRSNERLEFLGDSVLSLITSTYIYQKRTEDEEGDLTNLRSYIVKTKSLSEAAEKLGLGKYLRMSKGEEMGGGRTNTQLLANTYEALLGAIYLDQGFEVAKMFVHQTLLPLFEEEIRQGPPKDAKSALQEIAQEQTKKSPHYQIIKTTGPDHAKRFIVGVSISGEELGRGEGSSKQEAEEQAAAEALKKIQK